MRITTTTAETGRYTRYRRGTPTWCATVVLLGGLVAAQEFEISRWTIDSGGVIHGQGGSFELSGTTGQPDAGVLSGGRFELTGGFWFALPPADCNDDGLVNLVDTADFVSCMTGPAGRPPGDRCRCFDVNRSGAVELSDFAALQATYLGQ